MLEYIPIPLLKLIYPIRESNRKRDKELKVLCLGLGRTGTDSLRNALSELGYSEIHHGYHVVAPENVGECVQWARLGMAKYKFNDEAFLNRAEFDKCLGNCEAVTDLPSAAFGVEILRAYPDAKVVLNRRRDIQAWYDSQVKTIDTVNKDWPSWTRQWLESESFWIGRTYEWVAQAPYKWSFKDNGKQFYHDHYAALEAECRKEGREWLDWTVEDGWEPLCKWLGKPVPDRPFPSGNQQGDYMQRVAKIFVERNARGMRNLVRTASVIAVVGVAAATGWYFRGGV